MNTPVETLVAGLHDLGLRIGEVRLRFVLRFARDRLWLLATTFFATGFSLGVGLFTLAAFRVRFLLSLLFQTAHGLLDRFQASFAAIQFFRQLVASSRAQGGILFGVGLFSLLEQGRDFAPQPLDFLLHIAIAHGLVPRSIGSHLRSVQGEIAERDHSHFSGDSQDFDKQVGQGLEMDFAEVADRAEVGTLLADDRDEGHVTFASEGNFAAGKDAYRVSVKEQRTHHGHVERRCAAGFSFIVGINRREIELRYEFDEKEDEIVFRQDANRGDSGARVIVRFPFTKLLVCLHPCRPPNSSVLLDRLTRKHPILPLTHQVGQLVE